MQYFFNIFFINDNWHNLFYGFLLIWQHNVFLYFGYTALTDSADNLLGEILIIFLQSLGQLTPIRRKNIKMAINSGI